MAELLSFQLRLRMALRTLTLAWIRNLWSGHEAIFDNRSIQRDKRGGEKRRLYPTIGRKCNEATGSKVQTQCFIVLAAADESRWKHRLAGSCLAGPERRHRSLGSISLLSRPPIASPCSGQRNLYIEHLIHDRALAVL
jgi:hypothetical protein